MVNDQCLRNKFRIIVRTILRVIQVATGKKKVNFSLLIKISPGNWPKKGIFALTKNSKPTPTKITPPRIKGIANPSIGIIIFHLPNYQKIQKGRN
jgi:hypothetical protein